MLFNITILLSIHSSVCQMYVQLCMHNININNYKIQDNMSGDKKTSRQAVVDLRVLQKNMVYCSGLPSNLTQDQLKSDSYFGQYGKIQKLVINPFPNRNYCSVYLTYSHEFQAATTILACNQYEISRSTLWCLFGTMKYCKFFLKKIQCKNLPNCPYLHAFDHKNQIQIQNSPSQAFPQHEKLAKQVFKKYPQRIQQIRIQNKAPGQLPQPMYAVEYVEGQTNQSNKIQVLKQKQPKIVTQNENKQNFHTQQQAQGNNKSKVQTQTQTLGNNGNNSNNQEVQQQKQNIQINVQDLIRKLVLKHIQKTKGSKVIAALKQQEKSIKQVIIAGLLQ